MKFTKLMALALVLAMMVSAFAACGGDKPVETEPAETQPKPVVTEPVVTEPEETEPEETEACKHPRLKDGELVPATCTADGYKITICRLCDEEFKEVLPAAHIEAPLASTDGNYIKYTCTVCGEARVTDKDGNAVADASAIAFPFFTADFEGKADMTEVMLGFGEVALGANEFVFVVNNAAAGNAYVNVPSGTSNIAPNGFFTINDTNAKLATGDFSVKFDVQFVEIPTDEMALLTWNVGGASYEIVTIDDEANLSVIGATASVALEDKGWDSIEVQVDVDSGSVFVNLNGNRVAAGTLGASVAGKTDSSIKFFESVGQFEANVDNIAIAMISEAK